MHIEFTFKNFEPSEHLRKYARRRFEKVGRFLGKSPALSMQVVLSVDKFRHKAEVKLTGDNLNVSASEQSDDMYATIDMITDKVESQVRKHASRATEGRRAGRAQIDVYSYEVNEENGAQVVSGTENYAPKPLHLDEALLQFQQADKEVLVFFNAELERLNVIYKKRNGDFGLIDPVI